MLADDGCLIHGSMRKARSLSNGDAYSAVRITVAASTASRLVRARATGAAISHSPACTPVAATAVPSLAVPGLRCRVDSGAAHMQSGSALGARVREGFRTRPDEAAGSRRHGTVVGGGGVSGGSDGSDMADRVSGMGGCAAMRLGRREASADFAEAFGRLLKAGG